jgi:site-specific recombinase XerD
MLETFGDFPVAIRRLRNGLFGAHLDRFAEVLAERGYAKSSAWWQFKLLGKFDRWLVREKHTLLDLDDKLVEEFVEVRRRANILRHGDEVAIHRFVEHLRDQGIILRPVVVVEPSEIQRLKERYAKFLREERGLSPLTLENYWPFASCFLSSRFGDGPLKLGELTPADVSTFVVRHAKIVSPGLMKMLPTSLRSFFRFLFQKGETGIDLAVVVPTIKHWRQTELPKFLSAEEVERLVATCDRSTPTGRRDYAMFLLFARLGLRAGEVAALDLDHINWRDGEVLIPGKGLLHDRLPLLPDVGEALAEYLQRDRPDCSTRRVFIRSKAPHVGLSLGSSLSTIVKRAVDRAGIQVPRCGAHLFRHSLATNMLRGGASMAEIGEVLRHRSPNTTEIYAKVDVDGLRALAQAWPTAGDRA